MIKIIKKTAVPRQSVAPSALLRERLLGRLLPTNNIELSEAPPCPTSEVAPPDLPRLLSIDAAAALMDVSTQTVRREIRSGKLKSYRAGRQLRINLADLFNYLNR